MSTQAFIKTLESLNVSKDDLAKKIGIDRATLYRKLAKGGETFTLKEVHAIANVLKLNVSEVAEILLSDIEPANKWCTEKVRYAIRNGVVVQTNEIGKRINEIRIARNISYREITKGTGIPTSALHRYVTGETDKIPLDRIEKIADFLGTTSEYLVGWEEMKRKEEKSMLYVKKKFHEGTADEIEVKFDLYDDEIYCICPECGKEVQLDKESLIAILEDGDFAHSALLCKDCSQKIGGK